MDDKLHVIIKRMETFNLHINAMNQQLEMLERLSVIKAHHNKPYRNTHNERYRDDYL